MRVALEDSAQAPEAPGVYRFWSRDHKIVYVGKANSLRKRLAQYRSGREADSRVNISLLLRAEVALDWIVTHTEKEALILEDALIKEHRPRYNMRMRDDKAYLHLRITREHAYPRLVRVRRPTPGITELFGPYPSAYHVRQIQEVVQKIFPLRSCTDVKFANRSRPCLEHQIGRCGAPCVGKISPEAYAPYVEDLARFLRGDDRTLVREWKERMQAASRAMQFEEAARYRDLVQAAQMLTERQVVESGDDETLDCVSVEVQDERVAIAVVGVVRGAVAYNRVFGPFAYPGDLTEVMEQFCMQYYSHDHGIPARIMTDVPVESLESLQMVLAERRGKALSFVLPQRGDNRERLELARVQAQQALQGQASGPMRLAAVEKLLKLDAGSLHRVECFDVSEHHGDAVVGANVVFLYGEPAPEKHRRYRLDGPGHEDDFATMTEMLTRRVRRAIEDRDMPDMIVVDGGKGQLNVALRVFQDLEVEPPVLVALAKARGSLGQRADEPSERGTERLFLPGRANPILLKPGTPACLFFETLGHETHATAVGFHRRVHRGTALRGIEQIEGLGPRRRKALLAAYVNLEQVRQESPADVAAKAQLPLAVAERVVAYLQQLHAGQAS